MTTLHYESTPELARARPRPAPSPWPATLFLLIPFFMVLAIVAMFDTLAAGILYALVFLAISFIRPQIAMMLCFALAPFVQELPIPGPFHISIGEFSLALCLPAFFLSAGSRIRFAPFLYFTMLYLGACVFTTILNFDKDAITPLIQVFLYLILAVLVFSSFVRNPAYFTFILDGALIVSIILAFITWTPLAGALGLHKNSLGGSMASAMIIAIECWFAAGNNKKRRKILTVVMLILGATLLYSLSRGAWMACFAGIVVLTLLRRQFKPLIVLMAILIPVMLILFMTLPEEQREYATGVFDTRRENIKDRLEIIREAREKFNQHPAFGVGISYRKEVDATNIVLITLAESGILGLSTFLLLHLGVAVTVWKTQKSIPLNHPLYSAVALGAALVAAHFTHGLVDHYWSRGPILQAWAAAGMASAVYFAVKQSDQARRRRAAREAALAGDPAILPH